MAAAVEDTVAQRHKLCHGQTARTGLEQLQPGQQRHCLQPALVLRHPNDMLPESICWSATYGACRLTNWSRRQEIDRERREKQSTLHTALMQRQPTHMISCLTCSRMLETECLLGNHRPLARLMGHLLLRAIPRPHVVREHSPRPLLDQLRLRRRWRQHRRGHRDAPRVQARGDDAPVGALDVLPPVRSVRIVRTRQACGVGAGTRSSVSLMRNDNRHRPTRYVTCSIDSDRRASDLMAGR